MSLTIISGGVYIISNNHVATPLRLSVIHEIKDRVLDSVVQFRAASKAGLYCMPRIPGTYTGHGTSKELSFIHYKPSVAAQHLIKIEGYSRHFSCLFLTSRVALKSCTEMYPIIYSS
jgi:hypothetical protein